MNSSLLHLTGLQLLQKHNSESEELAQAWGMNGGRNRGQRHAAAEDRWKPGPTCIERKRTVSGQLIHLNNMSKSVG